MFVDYFKNCEIIVEKDNLVCSKSDYLKVIEAWILRYNHNILISLADEIIASLDIVLYYD